MGVIKHRGQIAASKRWPDRTRTIRVCSNRTQAKRLQAQMDAAVVNGTWQEFKEKLKLRNRDRVTLSDYSETYLEEYAKQRNKTKAWKRKETSLKALKRHLGGLELEAITPAHLHQFVRARKKEGVTDATINRDLTTLKHLLNYAFECGIIAVNRIQGFRNLKEEHKVRPRFTDEQIDAVIEQLRADVRPLFIFIRETGCRREEALSLKHSQVQEEDRLVVFSEDTKSRRYRFVPLTEAALEAVSALPSLELCPYVFYNVETKDRWFDCKKHWEQAREAAKVPELLIKDLRRHYAIGLAESGASMHDIQQVLGHASVSTTEKHYAHFAPDQSARKILRVLQGGKSSEVDTKRIHPAGSKASRRKGA